MSTVDPLSSVPQLLHHQTLRSPALNIRNWSSAPHPSCHAPLLATASSDKSVHIWDMRSWKLLSTISGGHKRSVRCVGWKDYGIHQRGKKRRIESGNEGEDQEGEGENAKRDPVVLATGSFDANAGLWVWNRDYRNKGSSGALVSTSQPQRLPGAFGDDGGEEEQERDFTNTNNGNEDENEEWHFSTLLTGPDSEIKDVKFSPAHYGANLLATCSRDKSVWVWEEVEPEEWETIAVLSEHAGDVKCLAWCGGARTTRRQLQGRVDRRGRTSSDGQAMDVDATDGTNTTNNGDGEDEEDEEELHLGSRELLASGSYDDTIRLYHDDESEGDWISIAVLTGHDGTVWDIKFEPFISLACYAASTTVDEIIADWTPRILSCSDDLSIRVWRKELSEKERDERRGRIEAAREGQKTNGGEGGDGDADVRQTGFVGRLPSVIRVGSSTEHWVEETRLPAVHMRSIYAVDWSARTGLVVSCGGDGIIVVYREVTAASGPDISMSNTNTNSAAPQEPDPLPKPSTNWVIIAAIEAAHDEYEVNHVCWAPRRDLRTRQQGQQHLVNGQLGGGVGVDRYEDEQEEEYIVSTGDDGDVRVWRVPESVLGVDG